MPCSDGGPSVSDYMQKNKEIDRLRALLCEACGIVDDAKLKVNMGLSLRKWWRKHQREDAERQAREAEKAKLKKLANKAISKLTTDEIEALREQHGLRFDSRRK